MAEILKQRVAEYVAEQVGDNNARVLIGGRDSSTGPVVAQNVNMSWSFGQRRDEFWINVNRPDATAALGSE